MVIVDKEIWGQASEARCHRRLTLAFIPFFGCLFGFHNYDGKCKNSSRGLQCITPWLRPSSPFCSSALRLARPNCSLLVERRGFAYLSGTFPSSGDFFWTPQKPARPKITFQAIVCRGPWGCWTWQSVTTWMKCTMCFFFLSSFLLSVSLHPQSL